MMPWPKGGAGAEYNDLCCSISSSRLYGLAGDMPQKTPSCQSCCRKMG